MPKEKKSRFVSHQLHTRAGNQSTSLCAQGYERVELRLCVCVLVYMVSMHTHAHMHTRTHTQTRMHPVSTYSLKHMQDKFVDKVGVFARKYMFRHKGEKNVRE